jgi:hypothetical protein
MTKVEGTNNEQSNNIQIDSCGNVYIIGLTSNTSINLYDGVIPDRTNSSITLGSAYSMNINNNSNTFENDHYIARYNTNGKLEWVTQVSTNLNSNNRSPINIIKIIIDHNNDIYLSGTYTNNIKLHDASYPPNLNSGTIYEYISVPNLSNFIVKYSSEGNIIWTSAIEGNNHQKNIDIILDHCDNLYVYGNYESIDSDNLIKVHNPTYPLNNTLPITTPNEITFNGNSYDYLVKYAPNGNILWATIVGSDMGVITSDKFITIDLCSNIYISTVTKSFDITVYDSEEPNNNVISLNNGYTNSIESNANIILFKISPRITSYDLQSSISNIKYITNDNHSHFTIFGNGNLRYQCEDIVQLYGTDFANLTLSPGPNDTWIVTDFNNIVFLRKKCNCLKTGCCTNIIFLTIAIQPDDPILDPGPRPGPITGPRPGPITEPGPITGPGPVPITGPRPFPILIPQTTTGSLIL